VSRLRVALLQMASQGGDVAANAAKAEAFCRRAAEQGADVALFPELWSVGYDRGFDPALAEPIDGPFPARFRALARALGLAIGVTWLERSAGKPRNAVALFDARGDLVLHTAKVHLCPWGPPDTECAPGDGFPVATLSTRAGRVAVGAMICFDREFPESAKLLALGGAELVLVPNACELDDRASGIGDLRIAQLRGRAWENLVAIALANYAAPQHDGRSCAFLADGSTVVLAGEKEEVVLADVDLDRLRAFRRQEAGRVTSRRPELYAAIAARRSATPE
jgi:predicted amidohydrolase